MMEAYQVFAVLLIIGTGWAILKILTLNDELMNAIEKVNDLKTRLLQEKMKLARLENKYEEIRETAQYYKNRVEYDKKDVPELRQLRHNVEKMKEFDRLEEYFVLNDDSIESYEISNDSFGFLTFTMYLNNPIRGERFGLTLENGHRYDCYIEKNKMVNNSSYSYPSYSYSGTGHFVPRLEDLLDETTN